MASKTTILTDGTLTISKITDGDNKYIVAEKLDNVLNANSVSVSLAIDYSSNYDRIAAALENANTQLVSVKTAAQTIATETSEGNILLEHIAKHFQVERAILAVIDIKDRDLSAVKAEIANPTLP